MVGVEKRLEGNDGLLELEAKCSVESSGDFAPFSCTVCFSVSSSVGIGSRIVIKLQAFVVLIGQTELAHCKAEGWPSWSKLA